MSAGPPNLQDVASRQGMQIKNGGITLTSNGWIRAGQTGYNVGSGWFVGYSGGVPKLSLGNPAGNYLTWDGTNLAISGSLILSTTGYVRGGQTAYDTGTGFFLGYSGGAYKLSIGNSAGSKLTWSGSSLNVVSSGTVIFDGAFTSSSGTQVSLDINPSKTSNVGLQAIGKLNGIVAAGGDLTLGGGYGIQGTSYVDGAGVLGRCSLASTGAGVVGTTDNATCPGVSAGSYLGTGLALRVGGTSTFSMQISSTLATGTAPLNVTSTTACTNLNADLLDGNHAAAFATAGHNHAGVYETVANTAKAVKYLTTGTPGSTTPAGYFQVQSIDGTVGPVYIAYYV